MDFVRSMGPIDRLHRDVGCREWEGGKIKLRIRHTAHDLASGLLQINKGAGIANTQRRLSYLPVYTRKSRLSKAKRLRLLEHFVAGTTARAAAELVGVNRFYFALRTIIAEEMEKAAPLTLGSEVSGSR